jgi:septal ring factor EnvC (AmiA/AmiB activator)
MNNSKKKLKEILTDQEKNIAEFKARIAKEKKENRADYEKKLIELENKNSDLKKKLADYKDDGQDKWISFKAEFNRDIDELGKAFKDLTVENI